MNDLKRYIQKRSKGDPEFAKGFESGYEQFKIGAVLRQARESVGLTQEEIADQLETRKSAISRIENSTGDIRLSTIEKYARAVGHELSLQIRPAAPRRTPALTRAARGRRPA
jgi:HTH-type transcriptional regulator / antitoxin HipB